jgi:orotate phosphoribosyltransferase
MTAMPAAKSVHTRHEVLPGTDSRWRRLHAIIEARSVMRGDFTLSSGAKSTFLFQLRQTTMFPEGQYLIGTIVEEFMRKIGVRTIGGLEVGAIPIVSAVAFASFSSGHPVDAFFVRKQVKGHGARELMDGEVKEGAEVLMVDDVTTTGGSILKAIDNASTERRITVRWALSIVDRDEGGAENLGARGIALASIFTKADFGL